MCGIVGIQKTNGRVPSDVFDRMVDSLASRGPDGRGVQSFSGGELFLGHRRLSIIDLSEAGSQPMPNEDQSIWLTFNGEIYNYLNLRNDLERCGHIFSSQSDSEIIVHAYEEWGPNCVKHFRGVFAFAIYDSHQKCLFLARDHVGVKPLYYYRDQNTFVFASQPRAILASDIPPVEVDHEAFAYYLAYGNVPGDKSIYKGIRKLLPGHWAFYKEGKFEAHQYWELKYSPVIFDAGEAEKQVRSKIIECVSMQTVSDVPIGTLLSGGVDSTIITSILASVIGSELSSYTIGFNEEESDERKYARFVAHKLGTHHHERVLKYEEACRLLPTIVGAYDEPFHLNSLFPYMYLSQLVQSSGMKVVLGGDGADELFAGYLWYEYFNEVQSTKEDLTPFQRLLRKPWEHSSKNVNQSVNNFFRYNGFFDENSQQLILGEKLAGLNFDVFSLLKKYWQPNLPPVLAAQMLDFNCFQVDHCLTKVDRASMACGVEVRVPFLDVELINLVFAIDHGIIFKAEERKSLLKGAMGAELPTGMDTARKKGFSSPLRVWLEKGLAATGESFIVGGSLCSRGLLDDCKIKDRYNSMHVGRKLLLISAELWARYWLEGDKTMTEHFFRECISPPSSH